MHAAATSARSRLTEIPAETISRQEATGSGTESPAILKLSGNLRQKQAGRTPDNTIRLDELGTLDRQALRDSLAIVRRFREWLGRLYRLDML